MTSNLSIKANHLIIYYDQDMNLSDGRGWCLESSDSETTVRFGTLAGVLAYAETEEPWLLKQPDRVVI